MAGECPPFFEERQPVCQPLKDLASVEKWQEGIDDLCIASEPLRTRAPHSRPKLLLCHDFKGGYIDDKFIQGSKNGNAYRFVQWQLADAFIYFSHYFVTIPPPGWTNAAHKHGVPMYGTVITEWDEGKNRCEEFLASRLSYIKLVEKLVAIAEYYRFDGWLINIENVIKAEHVENLRGFIGMLTRRMHEKVPHSRVIWYDSVINTGELKWQNELNDLNSQYFAECDGIFINYTWKDAELQRSQELAERLGRLHDVYIGIDVFGRGCRGGGGYNTKEALEAVHQHNLSAAIFAFGWVLESLGETNFLVNDLKFWSLLHPWCYNKPLGELPVSITFCQGCGTNLMSSGKVVSKEPWSNLTLQGIQPSLTCPLVGHDGTVTIEGLSVEWDFNNAVNGSSCLRLKGTTQENPIYFRLSELDCAVTEDDLLVGMVTQHPAAVSVALEMQLLRLENNKKAVHSLCLGASGSSELATAEVAKLLRDMEVLQSDSWRLSLYKVPVETTTTVKELGLQIQADEPTDFEIRVGQVFIFGRKQLETPLVTGLRFQRDSGVVDALVGTLSWTCPQGLVDHYLVYCDVPTTWTCLGHTHCNSFHVNLPAPPDQASFKVQPFTKTGFPIKLDLCLQVTVQTK